MPTINDAFINPRPGESRYVFAARGTEPVDDLPADLGDLVANGLAWEQIIDMYNWCGPSLASTAASDDNWRNCA